ncbi:MAG: hypothetical protein K2Q09_10255, partial [Phycisphaerales bacterium]|nr:hypothetical protein [Phycisphaerales bacterium]
MARKRKRLPTFLHTPVYLAMRTVFAGLGALPRHGLADAARGLARRYARAPFNRARFARAVENLEVAFPEWTRERRRETATRAYEHLFTLATETATLPRMLTTDGWPRHVDFGDVRAALERLMRDRPVILITGHCGNWELLGY